MSTLLSKFVNQYTPFLSLVLFKRNEPILDPLEDRRADFYLESYRFQKQKNGRYEMGAGVPVSDEALESFRVYFEQKKNDGSGSLRFKSKIIPENILHANSNGNDINFCFYLLRPERTLIFAESTGIPPLSIRLPNLVFHYRNKLHRKAHSRADFADRSH